VWFRIMQFWTAEKWVRVTDDEKNIRWLGMNIDPMQQQMIMQDPAAQEKVAGMVTSVAELDCDIIIDDAPDGLTPQLEQFQSLVELKKMDAKGEFPFRAIVQAMPNLKNKEQVLAAMDEGPPPQVQEMQQRMQAIEMAMAEAKVQETQASAALKSAQAQAALQPDMPQGQTMDPGPTDVELMETAASAEDKRASAYLKAMQAEKVRVETELAPHAMQQKFETDRAKARPQGSNSNIDTDEDASIVPAIQALVESNAAIAGAMQQMAQAASSPKRIVRGPDGRVAGVETV